MRSRLLWTVAAVAARVMMLFTVLTGLIAMFGSAFDRDAWTTVRTGFGVFAFAVFWHWIHLGARRRAAELGDGSARGASGSAGPWGIVGGVLTAVVFGGLLVLGFWASRSLQADRADAEAARDEAVRVAKDLELTVDRVRAVEMMVSVSAWDGEVDADPIADLLPLEHGRVVGTSVDGNSASLLIRPGGGGPPCAVVDIVRSNLVRGRLTDDC